MYYPQTEPLENDNWQSNVNIEEIEFYDDDKLKPEIFNKEIQQQVDQILSKSFHTKKEFPKKINKLLDYFERTDNFKNIIAQLDNNVLRIYFKPKSRHFQHFSQNFSMAGNVGVGYEIGLRNIFGALDKTSLKFDKDLGGATSLDFLQTFPTQNLLGKLTKIDYKVKIGQDLLSKNLMMAKKEFGLGIDDKYELKLLQKRLVFNPLNFQKINFEKFLDYKYFVDLKAVLFNRSFKGEFFHYQNTNIILNLINDFQGNTDFKFQSKFVQRTYLRKLLPLKFIKQDYKLFKTEVENTFDFNFLSNFQLNGFSIYNRPFYNNIRGFSNFEFNNPFNEQEKIPKPKFCLSLINSFKINFLHFPIFQNSQVHPFLHNTTFLNYTNSLFVNQSSGIGLKFKMNEMISMEGILNFHHFSNRTHKQNIEETFQLRFSLHDQFI